MQRVSEGLPPLLLVLVLLLLLLLLLSLSLSLSLSLVLVLALVLVLLLLLVLVLVLEKRNENRGRERGRLGSLHSTITQFENGAIQLRFPPVQRRGGNELLSLPWQLLQKRISPHGIEFPENIVEQEQGRRSFFKAKNPRLRDLQSERDRPLLAFGGVLICHFCLNQKLYVVAMRTDDGLAKTRFLRSRIRQMPGKVLLISRRKPELQGFSGATNPTMRFRRQGRQAFDQLRPHPAELRALFEERRVVGRDLAPTRLGRLQKRVSRAERAFVSAQGGPIKRIDLRRQEIQVTPPRFGSATNQVDVGIGKRNYPPETQIVIERSLFDVIQRHLPAQPAVTKFEQMSSASPGYAERFFSEAHDRRQGGAALGL